MTIRIEKDQALALVALAALIAALALPLFTTDLRLATSEWVSGTFGAKFRDWLAGAGVIPQREIYLTGILSSLFRRGEYLLLALTGLLGIAIPAASMGACAWLAFVRRQPATAEAGFLERLALATRWAMADVFLLTIVVALAAANGIGLHISAGPGAYCFAASVLLAMFARQETAKRLAPVNDDLACGEFEESTL